MFKSFLSKKERPLRHEEGHDQAHKRPQPLTSDRHLPSAKGAPSTLVADEARLFDPYHPVLKRLIDYVSERVIGREKAIEKMLAAILSGGHVLLEDVPGVGKTSLVRALSDALGLHFQRIQFTPDLLPGDVLGVSMYDQKNGEFVFRPGPVFANVVLADEINRASPKTQSALLEAMEEGRVTVDGQTYKLPQPFLVMATQNPVDYEGTYPLPEAQLDRFMMKLRLGYPDFQEEDAMLIRHAKERQEAHNKTHDSKRARQTNVADHTGSVHDAHDADDAYDAHTNHDVDHIPHVTHDTGNIPHATQDIDNIHRMNGEATEARDRVYGKRQVLASHPMYDTSVRQDEDHLEPEQFQSLQSAVTRVEMEESVRHYLLMLIQATRQDERLMLGASPRASLSLYRAAQALAFIRGRSYVLPDDIRELLPNVLAHRLIVKEEALYAGDTAESILSNLLGTIPVPIDKKR